jgi:RimJ/RimL family protein N-acetyltransferase
VHIVPAERERIQLQKARPGDVGTLARISERAFHHDIHYGAPGIGGPPGYRSERWQKRMMKLGEYYTIKIAGRIVGGVVVFRKRPREYNLGRIFVEPDYQNQGVGTAAFERLWQAYPLAKKWTLGTPAWNQRTRHFYKKVGFVELGADDRGGILFEKVIERPIRR